MLTQLLTMTTTHKFPSLGNLLVHLDEGLVQVLDVVVQVHQLLVHVHEFVLEGAMVLNVGNARLEKCSFIAFPSENEQIMVGTDLTKSRSY